MRLRYDALVVGGGATGAGTALDLALRGLRVALVERADLCDGTSGRYHGLLHSGGRYAVTDPESAHECIVENEIVRRIAPHSVEDTGGFFLTTPVDDVDFGDRWLKACHESGIPAEEIPVAVARREEPALHPQMQRVFRVPDASCDSFDLVHALANAIEAHGGSVMTYHELVELTAQDGKIAGATLRNARTGDHIPVAVDVVVNAAGAWAGEIAALAGCHLQVRPSKGTLVAMGYRFVNTVLNRCHRPSDGDILVPVGTVAVIGTTSVPADHPDERGVQAWEVAKLLDEAEKMVPGFSRARPLRAWAGVRPLYQEGTSAQEREVKRTFAVLDHEIRDGVSGLITVVGGKLTTYRLMAEKAADVAAGYLGVQQPCVTREFRVSDFAAPPTRTAHHHVLTHRLEKVEAEESPNSLICECELVTRAQLEQAMRENDTVGAEWVLDDLRRDLRLGMGPCQGGFCGFRAAGILQETGHVDAQQAACALADFVQRRWRGQRPLLWGQNLRQALLDEHIYRTVLGLDQFEGTRVEATVLDRGLER